MEFDRYCNLICSANFSNFMRIILGKPDDKRIVPVLIEIRCATKRPPRTARPVHKAWPRVPPIITPPTSCGEENRGSITRQKYKYPTVYW